MNHPNRSKVKDWPAHLRAFREKHGLNQRHLADMLPTSITNVANWEQGISTPPAMLKRALRDIAGELDRK
jgi:DNA-binding transcriptional regulator YiaG